MAQAPLLSYRVGRNLLNDRCASFGFICLNRKTHFTSDTFDDIGIMVPGLCDNPSLIASTVESELNNFSSCLKGCSW